LGGSATGSPKGNDFSADVETGYRLAMAGYNLEPKAGVEWQHIERQAFTENGAGALDLAAADATHTSVQSSLGARASRSYQIEDGFTIEPDLRAAWKHDFRDRVFVSGASLDDVAFSQSGPHMGRDAAVLGVGLAATNEQDLKVYVDYGTELRSRAYDQKISAGVRINF
jgi:outer membrane autotransporter protein